jgi:hypothetical protein
MRAGEMGRVRQTAAKAWRGLWHFGYNPLISRKFGDLHGVFTASSFCKEAFWQQGVADQAQ